MRNKPAPMKGILLGLVIDRPGYAYELASRLETRLLPTWRFNKTSVYNLLDNLQKDGLVRTELHERKERPRQRDYHYYHHTDEGEQWFRAWMDHKPIADPLRPEVLARLCVARIEDLPAMLRQLDALEREYLDMLVAVDTRERSVPEEANPIAAAFDDIAAEWSDQRINSDLATIGYARDRIQALIDRYQGSTR